MMKPTRRAFLTTSAATAATLTATGQALGANERVGVADRYLWSPPLGSAWDHGKQGPGRLRFAK